MISRTVEIFELSCKLYDKETDSILEKEVKVYSKPEKIDDLNDEFPQNLMLLTFDVLKSYKSKYKMSIKDFVKNGEEVKSKKEIIEETNKEVEPKELQTETNKSKKEKK